MDSLLANYASSDEEDQQQPIPAAPSKTTSSSTTSSSSSLFSVLPQPKSSSLFQSLPQPKQPPVSAIDDDHTPAPPSSSKFGGNASFFSSLPKPKSQIQQQQKPKKVVQFKPPIIPIRRPSEPDDDDDAEDDEEEERNRRRKMESSIQAPTVKSFLSSIPAPRNSSTLGAQSISGSGRRSVIEMEAPAAPVLEPAPASNSGGYEGNVPVDQSAGDYANYENYSGYQYGSEQNAGSGNFVDGGGASYGDYGSGFDQSASFQPEVGVAGTAGYGNDVATYAGYSTYSGDYGQNKWGDGSSASLAPEVSGPGDSAAIFPKKRGRREIPAEIIEVKQEELIKNRPREDQAKLTGLAFGPSYQPVSSAKGKPTKLHKRKHQIGSLYFDMKQNEMQLAERRAKGMLTKAETQAKYGW